MVKIGDLYRAATMIISTLSAADASLACQQARDGGAPGVTHWSQTALTAA